MILVRSQVEMKNKLLKTGGKSNPCYRVANNFVDLCSIVLWEVELARNKIGYLAEISKQSIEGEAWVFLNTHIKHNRDKFRGEKHY